MDQESKYWREKWKEVVKLNIQLRQELLDLNDTLRANAADRETIKRLKEKKRAK